MEDEKIIELYWQRQEQALTETEKKYAPYLKKIAWNILADLQDSEESVNDTYLAAWNAMPPQRPHVLSAFLGKITRRISIDRWRARHAEKRKPSEYALSLSELQDCISGESTPETELNVKLLGEAISRFLFSLPKETRTLFVARYYFLDPLKEAAKTCGMTVSRAKSLLYRTRCALREHLQKEGFFQ